MRIRSALAAAMTALLLLAGGCKKEEKRALSRPIDHALRTARESREAAQVRSRHRLELGAAQTVTGKVEMAAKTFVIIDPGDEPHMVLRVEPATTVSIDGHAVDAAKIPVGTEVRATFKLRDDKPVANHIVSTDRHNVSGRD